MLIVQDTKTNDVIRIITVDALVQLGEVRAGKHVRRFDPQRLLGYFRAVNDHLLSFASRYGDAYRYLPLRNRPNPSAAPLIGDLYEGTTDIARSWLVDLFLVAPLVKVGDIVLPSNQQTSNVRLARNWCLMSQHSSRLYVAQDLRQGRVDDPGWVTFVTASDLSGGHSSISTRALTTAIERNSPLIVSLSGTEDVDTLLEWLVRLREGHADTPRLMFHIRSYEEWEGSIGRLLDIPKSMLLTSGATITRLSEVIRYLRRHDGGDWSRRLVFASAYPETQSGDSIPEILSFLLSKSLSATPLDLHRILGGNLLGMLPPRPTFLRLADSKASVVMEATLGRLGLREITRFLKVLLRGDRVGLVSVDFMVTKEGRVSTSDAVLTLADIYESTARAFALCTERDGTLIATGWRGSFEEVLEERDDDTFRTIVRSTASSEATVFDSPAHLNQLGAMLVRFLGLSEANAVLSALHYRVSVRHSSPGMVLMAPEDLSALGIASGERAIILHSGTRQWWGGTVRELNTIPRHEVGISDREAGLFGANEGTSVDVVRCQMTPQTLEELVIGFERSDGHVSIEDDAYLYMHHQAIRQRLEGAMVGIGTRLNVFPTDTTIRASVIATEPPLMPGQLGRVTEETRIQTVPVPLLREMNVVLCIISHGHTSEATLPVEDPMSIRRRLEPLQQVVPRFSEIGERIERTVDRRSATVIAGLLILSALSQNRSQGRLALIRGGERVERFGIQKGQLVKHFAEFEDDLSTQEILHSIVASIVELAGGQDTYSPDEDLYQAIAETLYEMGDDMPTMVIVLSDTRPNPSDDAEVFLRAIATHKRYTIDWLTLGAEEQPTPGERLMKLINSRIFVLAQLSAREILAYLLTAVQYR